MKAICVSAFGGPEVARTHFSIQNGRTPRLVSIGPIWQPTRHDLSPPLIIGQKQYQSTMDALP